VLPPDEGIGEDPRAIGAGILGDGGRVVTGFDDGAAWRSFFIDEYGICVLVFLVTLAAGLGVSLTPGAETAIAVNGLRYLVFCGDTAAGLCDPLPP
jgi:hypothetical protein